MPKPVLHLMSGKIASGKSTLAKRLAFERSAILLSEDHWLSRLYPDQIKSVTDYVRLARQIREVVGPFVIDVLNAGVTVVLDFPANTPQDRQWLRGLADAAEVSHCVHYVEVDDEICRGRLHLRNRRAEHEFAATDVEFDLITSYFRAPDEDGGYRLKFTAFDRQVLLEIELSGMSTSGRLLSVVTDSNRHFSADHRYETCWSTPTQSVVRCNANDWSSSVQFRT